MEINELRTRYLQGGTLTLEETQAMLASIRRGYKAAQAPKPKTAAAKKAASKPSLSMAELDKLFG